MPETLVELKRDGVLAWRLAHFDIDRWANGV